jgi:hypothetical protein
MRKFLFVFTSAVILAMIIPAVAQNVPSPPGVPVTPGGSFGVTDPNAVNRECARGFSAETCLRRENAIESGAPSVTDSTKNYLGECAVGSSEETCRRRGQKYNPPGQN